METNKRPHFPKRAVITAGMPYGNKSLHFGHVGGVFVPADCFARFLKDRIGPANVRFVSGTDCFGSPIDEGYRKLKEAGKFDGTIEPGKSLTGYIPFEIKGDWMKLRLEYKPDTSRSNDYIVYDIAFEDVVKRYE